MRVFILLFIAAGFTQCLQSQSDESLSDYDHVKVPYLVNEPTRILSLHSELEEISGLSFYQRNMLVAVQDEKGKLYFIDLANGEIKRELKFYKSGDYEGVEIIGDQVYVTESDGDIYVFSIKSQDQAEVERIKTAFSRDNDIEGLASIQGDIVLLTKASGEIKDNGIKGKAAYFYDDAKKEIDLDPLFSFRIKDLEHFIGDREYFNELKDFDPSGFAEHPATKDIYIISADRALLILDPEYKIKEIVKLSRRIYKQPEGICFDPEGRLYISNEGDGARAKLVIIDQIR
ncbi:MAG: SdiA-regulated domain-containing protein [Bacteroidota bacterium]